MASVIDDTKPVTGTPTTQSVRDNFAAAKLEITALQASVPTWTVGSVPFATSTTALGQDNANLIWDDANNRLGIGTATPGSPLEVRGLGGNPPTTGTTRTGLQFFAVTNPGDGSACTFGIYPGGLGTWIQSHDATAQQAAYPLLFNPVAGNVGVHTANPTSQFTVSGVCANTSGAWTTISDASVKTIVEDYRTGLAEILQLAPVQFRYLPRTPFNETDAPGDLLFGLVADDVAPIVPEIVGKTTATIAGKKTELSTLEPGNLIYACLNAIKTLKAEIDELKLRLEAAP